MEIELKLPLIEIAYTPLTIILIALRYTLLIGGVIFALYLGPISVVMIVVSFVLLIVNSHFKNYKVIGEIIFGYHSIRVNGQYVSIKEIEKISSRFEREDQLPRHKLVATVSGARNLICFYVNGVKQTHRVLMNYSDQQALDFLIKKWEELYGLKMGRLL
ncbi:hypothetical protein [Chitinophaga sp.]|uniref:hypothetical protein n=1 Tax=Chitinophaga sp. TaxID=1869181 RepID=UPI0031CECC36